MAVSKKMNFWLSDDENQEIVLTSQTKVNLLRLYRFIESVINPESRNTNSIIPFIQRTLRQRQLNDDALAVFIISCERAIKKIKAGEKIGNIPAFIRGISFKVIQELSREYHPQNQLIDKLKNRTEFTAGEEFLIPEYTTDYNVQRIIEAWEKLTSEERKILWFRIVEEFSWSEIADYLVEEGNEQKKDDKLIPRLRKRCCRALDKLRKSFD